MAQIFGEGIIVEDGAVIDRLTVLDQLIAPFFPPSVAVQYQQENLGAGVDIAARAFYVARQALTVTHVDVIHEGASAGIGAAPNDAVLTLRNVTQGVDVATVTLVADVAANAVTVLALVNASIAAGDVLGIVVTQNGTADLAIVDWAIRAVAA